MRNEKERGIARIISAIAVLTACALPAAAWGIDIGAPAGWRRAGPAELALAWRGTDPLRYTVVLGDFDGNGSDDEAQLLVSDRLNRSGLFVFLRQADGTHRRHALGSDFHRSLTPAMGIRKLPPGVYTTACGKGYFDCGPKRSKEISARHTVIEFFKFESSSAYYYWDRSKKKFAEAWIVD
ncbi:hypothetical protein [Pseudoduganella buxea]|uniref:VCBS repeat-containing protein n=1 Tax=Pseudoduganella buxea TaxID=1949069 RepID=A0A6I3SVI2_9BURK|nr:hypothetical protein [Pseudoduganella buxea]MTV52282.1 hypothetical protein [Pseudoduganella buxea]GGB86701.1 hypothetical protein GCM10011572_05850 [Pseudoduganella buxea]